MAQAHHGNLSASSGVIQCMEIALQTELVTVWVCRDFYRLSFDVLRAVFYCERELDKAADGLDDSRVCYA